MDDVVYLYFFFGILFLFVVWGFMRLPYLHKEQRERAVEKDQFYELDDIDEEIPLERKIGKLVRKTIDKSSQRRYRRYAVEPMTRKRGYYWKYYLTFETFQGYKSFTVTKEEYQKVSKNTYGYLYFQDTRYSHFDVRNRENLNLDELIQKNYKN